MGQIRYSHYIINFTFLTFFVNRIHNKYLLSFMYAINMTEIVGTSEIQSAVYGMRRGPVAAGGSRLGDGVASGCGSGRRSGRAISSARSWPRPPHPHPQLQPQPQLRAPTMPSAIILILLRSKFICIPT